MRWMTLSPTGHSKVQEEGGISSPQPIPKCNAFSLFFLPPQ